MNTVKLAAFASIAVVGVAAPAAADVRLTMHDGLVTLVAKDATIGQILAAWATVGQATIINGDRIAGAPVTMEFADVPEKQALDILLRSVSGYLAAPRPTIIPNASRFDRIIVLPSTVQARTASASSAPPPIQQQRPAERQTLPPEFESAPLQNVPGPNSPTDPSYRVPGVNQYVPPVNQAGQPQQGPGPAGAAPAMPTGSSTPGTILQPPPQPGQPGQQPAGRF